MADVNKVVDTIQAEIKTLLNSKLGSSLYETSEGSEPSYLPGGGEVQLEQARDAIMNCKQKEALEVLLRLAEKHPYDIKIHFYLGLAYCRGEIQDARYDLAIFHLEEMIKCDPNNVNMPHAQVLLEHLKEGLKFQKKFPAQNSSSLNLDKKSDAKSQIKSKQKASCFCF